MSRREVRALTKLIVTFEGPRVGEDGVPLEDLQAALGHLQRAFRHMVDHLRGGADQPGPPTEPMRRSGLLRQGAPSAGLVEAELVLSAGSDSGEAPAVHCLAVERLLGWREDLGEGGDQFPPIVVEEMAAVGSDLSPVVSVVRLADPVSGRCLELRRKEIAEPPGEQIEDAFLHGWLKEVNWHDRTAQLHKGDGSRVPLRFDAALDWEMLRLATSYVKICGRATFEDDDSIKMFHVERISGTRSCREPSDLEAFLNDPNPKIFDPDDLVTASEPFDVDEFLRTIYEGRSVRKEWMPG